jgi:hypothetical protein
MSTDAEVPAEFARLKGGFGATPRAAGLPQPPTRPVVAVELAEPSPVVTTTDAAPPPPELVSAPELTPPPDLAADILQQFIAQPRAAVMATEAHRKASPKRQLGSYLVEDSYRTLQYLAYLDGCESWKWLDTAVRSIAEARGIETRAYSDEELGRR